MSDLIDLACEARERAYAAYSGYSVGAALESAGGRIFTGANVENVSYGATMCAERVALFTMAATGERSFRRIAVATRDGGTPCGLCLQVLLEFAPDPASVEVIVAGEDRKARTFMLSELIPFGFRSEQVGRTEEGR